MKTVLIVDDHPIVREGFKKLIHNEKDFNVTGTEESASGALNFVNKQKPDIAMVDLSLKDRSGMELIKDLQLSYPEIKILVVSLHDEEVYAERVLRAGARGFIMKSENVEEIITAMKKIASGEVYLSMRMQSRVLEKVTGGGYHKNFNPVEILSDRELEVFELIGEGKKTSQIAEKLKLSIKTIDTYKSHLKIKLNLKNGVELMQRAVEWKFERYPVLEKI